MRKQVQVNVTYAGGHNFDWDTQLEEIAGKVRHDSSMDFERMLRTISFSFDEEVLIENGDNVEVTRAELFVAAARSTFPDFTIGVAA